MAVARGRAPGQELAAARSRWLTVLPDLLVEVVDVDGLVHTVELEVHGQVHTLQVPEDETILSAALDQGLDVPHDCKLGVCMTCPSKLEKGALDQSEGMLSDDVQELGYALMCVSYPRSDCKVRIIPEEELLSLQLMTSD
eukprot:SM000328S12462  [mRNA]  locus=s328:81613:83195:+ [translate_table: standard]